MDAHERRREQLLKARARRALLIEEQLKNPRARKAVPQWISGDMLSGYYRAAARFYCMAEREHAQRSKPNV